MSYRSTPSVPSLYSRLSFIIVNISVTLSRLRLLLSLLEPISYWAERINSSHSRISSLETSLENRSRAYLTPCLPEPGKIVSIPAENEVWRSCRILLCLKRSVVFCSDTFQWALSEFRRSWQGWTISTEQCSIWGTRDWRIPSRATKVSDGHVLCAERVVGHVPN